jgi:anti-sigma regulatory factor (Ser/Thr protein kinase)
VLLCGGCGTPAITAGKGEPELPWLGGHTARLTRHRLAQNRSGDHPTIEGNHRRVGAAPTADVAGRWPGAPHGEAAGFRHEAFFYSDVDDFVGGTLSFVRTGVRAGEPVLVVVSAAKIDLLRRRLSSDERPGVSFADIHDVGSNPARIIPAWADFVKEHDGGPVRGVGEPIWAERPAAEVVECQRHEELLNVAFATSPGFTLMCPYDLSSLHETVVDEALRSHPVVRRTDDGAVASHHYLGNERIGCPFSEPLSEPPEEALRVDFDADNLPEVRALVLRQAAVAGLDTARSADAMLAVNEAASNSLRHGGGRGSLQVWRTGEALVCEVRDDGQITEPLVGRERPDPSARGGRGLWMMNQLCDLVQVRTFLPGTTVRLHVRPRPA